ncbi:MAG: hypothetical protein MJ118_02940 [Clostridia bacterium]|nr:hypothetical protein [Clostridia bacterium]
MKKIIAVLLAVSMLFAFAACAKTEKADQNEAAKQDEAEQNVGMPNPMREVTAEELEFNVNVPEGATDVKYFIIEDGNSKMNQVSYMLDGKEFCCRMQSTGETAAYDMSGIFSDNWESETTTVSYCDAVAKTCSEGSVIYWLDLVPGINYTLSCTQKLSAAELSEEAGQLFAPMQGEVDGDEVEGNEVEEIPAIAEGHYVDELADSVDLISTGADTYHVKISITRLARVEGEGTWEEGSVKFTVTAPDGSSITGRFFPSVDSEDYSLCFTDSGWSLLESGTTFEGFEAMIAGGHYADENADTVDLDSTGAGTYQVTIGITHLSTFEGEGTWEEGSVKFTVTAPDGSSITGRFFQSVEGEGYSLCFTDSGWSLLESGTTFEGFLFTQGA